MEIVGHGVDVIACGRVEEVIERHGDRLVRRVFTDREAAYCRMHRQPIERFAGRFAAKEAVLKAIGTGWRNGIAWTDTEVVNDALGQPLVNLSGYLLELARQRGISRILISISHTPEYAVASAIAVADKTGEKP